MNRYTLGLGLIVIYVITILVWVFMDRGFDGMKWLTIWFLTSTLFFGFWLGYIYSTTPVEKLKSEKKGYISGHIKIGVLLVLVVAMATGLNNKVAVLFLDIDAYIPELKQAQVIMRGGSNFKPVGPRSAGGRWPTMDVLDGDKGKIPTCHLILKDDCEYGYMINQAFDIKYADGFGYPIKNSSLVFEIKSKDYYKDVEYHINLYKTNQYYVWYFLFFVVLASMIIVFLIPYLMFLNQNRKGIASI